MESIKLHVLGGKTSGALESAPSLGKTGMRADGKLDLRFRMNRGKTTMRMVEQRPPLKVVRGFELDDGECLAHIHNVSGGVLDGDRLDLRLDVGSNARAQVTSTGAARIYRSRGDISVQRTHIHIAESGLLEYLPDQLIPFRNSRYRQVTTVDMAEDAGLFWWETVAPGRQAHGELFDYDLLQIETEVYARDRPAVMENVRLEPGLRSMTSSLRMGPYRHFSTFYMIRIGWPQARWLKLESDLQALAVRLTEVPKVIWGVSTTAAHGLVVRGMSATGQELPSGLLAFWSSARREIYGRSAVPPRKVW
ncbi:MAG TPA: urease accessory protein UreD [Armatimonadota bacterium]|nr:urease accessory protein UreD [Armatimonadota bacterium]